jgi:hypothetical protein
MYGQRGYTKKVVEMLNGLEKVQLKNYVWFKVSARRLLEIAEILPKENLNDRHNEAPTLNDFLELARRDSRTVFEGYIITDERDDERVTISAVHIPLSRTDLKDFILSKALDKPDEYEIYRVGNERFIKLFWD